MTEQLKIPILLSKFKLDLIEINFRKGNNPPLLKPLLCFTLWSVLRIKNNKFWYFYFSFPCIERKTGSMF